MDRKFLTNKHPLWHANIQNWEFYIRIISWAATIIVMVIIYIDIS